MGHIFDPKSWSGEVNISNLIPRGRVVSTTSTEKNTTLRLLATIYENKWIMLFCNSWEAKVLNSYHFSFPMTKPTEKYREEVKSILRALLVEKIKINFSLL